MSRAPVIVRSNNGPVTSATSRTLWCGPYALALISGLDYDTVYAKALRKVRAKKQSYEYKPASLKGMYPSDLEAVAKTLKAPFTFKALDKRWNKRDQLTLGKSMDYLRPNRIYVVMVTGHFLVVNTTDWTYCDNIDEGWYPVSSSRHVRAKVERAGEVNQHKVF